MDTAQQLVEKAERIARETETWADLSNALFNPVDGLVAKAYPTRAAREAFIQTEEYRRIRDLIADSRERHGLVEGGTPKRSHSFVVQLPQSLRTALEREAEEEGVSLDQLVLTKLAIGLNRLTGVDPRPEQTVNQAATSHE
jgi:predicted HicB family RNase H-like nuclease